jgi:uncharacterized membrane protein HdeD (DUF308 family)
MSAIAVVADMSELHRKWIWLLLLGILLMILGVVALAIVPAATLGTAMVLGWIMIVSGVMETIHAFQVKGWGGVVLHLIGGLLGIFVGLLVVTHPVAGALVWTLLFASLFTVFGLFRTIVAIAMKFPHWGWMAFDGIVTFALGILLWAEWPWSGIWFLGVSVGITLLLRGWAYALFAFAVHHLPVARQAEGTV